MAKKIRIKQVGSTIGRIENQKRVMRALGIKRLAQTVVHKDSTAIRGMIEKVRHLVVVDESDGE
jgi:large subunit ribosomal protein L30